LKLGLNFEDFHLLDVIANMLLKNSAFIRSLNMHLYQSNINLKIDIPYSLSLPYLFKLSFFSSYLSFYTQIRLIQLEMYEIYICNVT